MQAGFLNSYVICGSIFYISLGNFYNIYKRVIIWYLVLFNKKLAKNLCDRM